MSPGERVESGYFDTNARQSNKGLTFKLFILQMSIQETNNGNFSSWGVLLLCALSQALGDRTAQDFYLFFLRKRQKKVGDFSLHFQYFDQIYL